MAEAPVTISSGQLEALLRPLMQQALQASSSNNDHSQAQLGNTHLVPDMYNAFVTQKLPQSSTQQAGSNDTLTVRHTHPLQC